MRTPRSDSVLKNLPPEVRDAIVDFKRDRHSLQETVEWLAGEHQVKTNLQSLSEFIPWQETERRMRDRESRINAILDEERRLHPEVSDAELFQLGQRIFSQMALAEEDAKAWTSVQKLTLDERQAALDREKFELLKRRAEQADKTEKVITDADLSPAEREQRIKEIYGRA